MNWAPSLVLTPLVETYGEPQSPAELDCKPNGGFHDRLILRSSRPLKPLVERGFLTQEAHPPVPENDYMEWRATEPAPTDEILGY